MKGLYLQGAGWDMKNACLVEAEPMQLVCPMPTIHFKPVEGRRKSQRGVYRTLNISHVPNLVLSLLLCTYTCYLELTNQRCLTVI